MVFDSVPPVVLEDAQALYAPERPLVITTPLASDITHMRARVRQRAAWSFIYHPEYQRQKEAFLKDLERDGILVDFFHRAHLLIPPQTQDQDAWHGYHERFETLLRTDAAREFYSRLQQGWRVVTLFSATRDSVIIAFIDPRDPDVLRTQNFNFGHTDDVTQPTPPFFPPNTLALSIEMIALQKQLEAFHRHVENALQQCIPSDFSNMYLALQKAMIEKKRDPSAPVLEEVQRAAIEYANAFGNSLKTNLSSVKTLPDFHLIHALHDESRMIFGEDILRLGDLSEELYTRALAIDGVPFEDAFAFYDGTEKLRETESPGVTLESVPESIPEFGLELKP